MNSLDAFSSERKKHNKVCAKLTFIAMILLILVMMFVDPIAITYVLSLGITESSGFVTFLVYVLTIILFCIAFGPFYRKYDLKFINKVYPGFRVIKKKEFAMLSDLKARDRVGNIINEQLIVKTVNDKTNIFKDYYNNTLYGIECLVGRFKFQVFEGVFYEKGKNISDENVKFKGLVFVIREPNQLSGDRLIRFLDEYALRKQNGRLKSYDNATFYTNSYKCKGCCVVKFEGSSIINSIDDECWQGCLLINELVALLRSMEYDEVIV